MLAHRTKKGQCGVWLYVHSHLAVARNPFGSFNTGILLILLAATFLISCSEVKTSDYSVGREQIKDGVLYLNDTGVEIPVDAYVDSDVGHRCSSGHEGILVINAGTVGEGPIVSIDIFFDGTTLPDTIRVEDFNADCNFNTTPTVIFTDYRTMPVTNCVASSGTLELSIAPLSERYSLFKGRFTNATFNCRSGNVDASFDLSFETDGLDRRRE